MRRAAPSYRSRNREGYRSRAAPSELEDVVDGALDLTAVKRPSTQPLNIQIAILLDQSEQGVSVRGLTDKIETFPLVDASLQRPPRVLITWGNGASFEGTFETVRTGFSLFLADGTPVRAVVLAQVVTATDCVLAAP